jgi:hypothetical protein
LNLRRGNDVQDVDLTFMSPCDSVIIRLPDGRLMELEWLEGINYSIKVRGFKSQQHYDTDEASRLLGFEPQFRSFNEYIPMRN